MQTSPSPAHPSVLAPRFLIGVDGGGTGTRARLQDAQGQTLGEGRAGPSGLSQGIAQAWHHVLQAVAHAFADAGLTPTPPADIALGLGLAGAIVPAQRQAFLAADPGYVACVLHSDAIALLVGAHRGRPGIIVAAGTGSVGAVHTAAGALREVGGWGFPVGDEGGGAWLGLHAMQAAQAAYDGRAAGGALTDAVLQRCGPDASSLLAWCANARQHAYAQVAPLVFDAAEAGDPVAEALLQAAADELARHVYALQPAQEPLLAVAVGGSIGLRLAERWPADLRARRVEPAGDSADGALHLLRKALGVVA